VTFEPTEFLFYTCLSSTNNVDTLLKKIYAFLLSCCVTLYHYASNVEFIVFLHYCYLVIDHDVTYLYINIITQYYFVNYAREEMSNSILLTVLLYSD